jgi:hypothetical protein
VLLETVHTLVVTLDIATLKVDVDVGLNEKGTEPTALLARLATLKVIVCACLAIAMPALTCVAFAYVESPS